MAECWKSRLEPWKSFCLILEYVNGGDLFDAIREAVSTFCEPLALLSILTRAIQNLSVLRSEAVHGGRRGKDNQRCGRCSGFSTRPSDKDSKIEKN